MTGVRISEAAARSGLTASSLRFYERAGVLQEPARSPAGYRLYSDADVRRLAFLARARDLGLGLDDARELLEAWDGATCEGAQRRMVDLVREKVASVERRITELSALVVELERVSQGLSDVAPSGGRCGPACVCMTAVTPALRAVGTTSSARPLSQRGPVRRDRGAGVDCSLPDAELVDRLAAWRQVLSGASGRERIAGGVRVELPAEPALAARVAELVAREQSCCSFVRFTMTVLAPGRLVLEATAPEHGAALVDELLGAPA